MFLKNNTFINKKAFTLIELLVVISIISLLIAILLPAINKAKMMAVRIKCAHNLKQINIAMNLYCDGNDNFYPAASDPVDNTVWLWMGRGFRPFIEPYLSMEKGQKNANVLICPADKVSTNLYDDTSYAYSMCFYHSPGQIDSLSKTSDQYSNPLPTIPQKVGSAKQPAKKIITGEWLSNHKKIADDLGWWCNAGARNFLFADSHYEYLPTEKINPANDTYPNPNLTKSGINGQDTK
ncbi:MAG TPA: prepilin-type N-terminal cleavage/methylation domain-containing protein [Sedimentisphaerales bacterium]|nr:prepilin-type N-terminal cleavage/methylation domain-containing protein [Sedimentisphaerales bacterium]